MTPKEIALYSKYARIKERNAFIVEAINCIFFCLFVAILLFI
jgi:hypothetical protein